MTGNIRNSIFRIRNFNDFVIRALEIFNYQAENNPVYNKFINYLGVEPRSVTHIDGIPFMPVGFFKNHRIITGDSPVKTVFESSGTTRSKKSRHYITDPEIYDDSLINSFRYFYGDPEDYSFAALLPSYIERGNSSLAYMVDRLIRKSNDNRSGFYLNNPDDLMTLPERLMSVNRKGVLIGVSFALLDLAGKYSPDLSEFIVIETGGMKGRQKEMTRQELHSILRKAFNLNYIHSEYGMTELLSQAWSKGEGVFQSPPWMKILIRDTRDPMDIMNTPGLTGAINIIDLANINSCSFIATDDLGKLNEDGSFEVLGRFDNSDIRGCNLLLE
jgi:phenylacetate-coenzyme A ligase PaaK-like adenylate-forming protein